MRRNALDTLIDHIAAGEPLYVVGASAPAEPRFLCSHVCCVVPNDPMHQHLFESSECPQCREIEREWQR